MKSSPKSFGALRPEAHFLDALKSLKSEQSAFLQQMDDLKIKAVLQLEDEVRESKEQRQQKKADGGADADPEFDNSRFD